jgi:hypothetical protein
LPGAFKILLRLGPTVLLTDAAAGQQRLCMLKASIEEWVAEPKKPEGKSKRVKP